MTMLSGWGRHPVVEGIERLSEDLERVCPGAVLSRGLGRSYGDASLPPRADAPVVGTRLADRVLAFDTERGVLRAEAGLALGDLQGLALPRGWASPVLPGTGHVTLGGAVAADVHGKNHHVAGCFGAHVRALRLVVADGRVLEIGPECEPELFFATVGGMGLTGHILEVEVQLEAVPSPLIQAEAEAVDGLDAVLTELRRASDSWPFTAAWVDGIAGGGRRLRGVIHRGRWAAGAPTNGHAPPAPRRLPVPARSPRLAQRWSVGAFDALVYLRHRWLPKAGLVHPEAFFHPLDNLVGWNRLYGRGGMTQHQCVLPEAAGDEAVHRLLAALANSGARSYLIVIKNTGAQGRGLLSFPLPGTSLALDLPVDGRAQAAVDAMNEVVLEAGGRIYLAKDALTRAEHFAAMEGERLDAFDAVRRAWDPEGRFASALSVRLLGDAA